MTTQTVNTPLATMFIKIGFLFSKDELKSEITKVTSASEKVVRHHVTSLNKMVHQIGQVAYKVRAFSNAIFKALVLPAGVGTSGVYTFMQSTDKGARQLQLSLNYLRYSWMQLQARLGNFIANSLHLKTVFEKLARIMDNMGQKQFEQIFDTAKLVAFVGVLGKASAILITMYKTLVKMAVAQSVIGGTGGGRGMAGVKNIFDIGGMMRRIMNMPMLETVSGALVSLLKFSRFRTAKVRELTKEYLDKRLSLPKEERIAMVREIRSLQDITKTLIGAKSDVRSMTHIALYNADVIGKVLSKISAFGSFIAKATAILGAFIVGFKIFQGIFKGFDRDLAKDLFSAFKWLADKIIWVGNWIAKSFEAFSQAAETSILFFKNKLGILSDAEYNKRTTDIWLGKPGEGKERYNFTKSIGTTSFAGLNRAAQDMSLNREAIKLAQSQLDQLKVIAENTKTKVPFKGSDNTGAIMINNAVSAFSEMPWLQKASMLTMLIP